MIFLIFILSMFLVLEKNSVSQHYNITQIEFATYTRGYHKTIIVTQHELIISEQSVVDASEHITKRKINPEEWKKISDVLQRVRIAEIPSLSSPTNKRASDGARASAITVSTPDGKQYSHSFDNEDPNEKLRPLMQCIHDLAERSADKNAGDDHKLDN